MQLKNPHAHLQLKKETSRLVGQLVFQNVSHSMNSRTQLKNQQELAERTAFAQPQILMVDQVDPLMEPASLFANQMSHLVDID